MKNNYVSYNQIHFISVKKGKAVCGVAGSLGCRVTEAQCHSLFDNSLILKPWLLSRAEVSSAEK